MREFLFLFLSFFSILNGNAKDISCESVDDDSFSWFESGIAFTTIHNGNIVNCSYYAAGDTSVKLIDVGFQVLDSKTYEKKYSSQLKYYNKLQEVVPEVNLDEYGHERFLKLLPKAVFDDDNIVLEIDNSLYHINYKEAQPNIVKHYSSKGEIYEPFVIDGISYTTEEDGIYEIKDNGAISHKIKWSKVAYDVINTRLSIDQESQKGFLVLEGNNKGKTIFFDLKDRSVTKEKDDALAIAMLNDIEMISYNDDFKIGFNVSNINDEKLIATHNESTLENYTLGKVVVCEDRFIAIEATRASQKIFVFEKSSGDLKKIIDKPEDQKKMKGPFLAGFSYPNLMFFQPNKDQESLSSLYREVVDNVPPRLFLGEFSVDKPNDIEQANVLIDGRYLDESVVKSVVINGESLEVDSKDNSFVHIVSLEEGYNEVVIEAIDVQNNKQVDTIVFNRQVRLEVSRGAKPKTVSAEKRIRNFNYKALLIANQNYTNGTKSLKFPIRDAESIKRVLVEDYSFNNEDVLLLKDATRSDIINTLDSLASHITPQDNLLIFYAGHGIFDENLKKGYWLPVNAHPTYKNDWVSNSDIRDYITAFKSQHTLLVSDACFSGSIFEYDQRSVATTEERITEKLLQKKSRKAITSGLNKTVPDESVFVKYLISELKNNTNEFVRAGDLYAGIREAVMANTDNNPQYEVIKNSDHEGGEFVFLKKE